MFSPKVEAEYHRLADVIRQQVDLSGSIERGRLKPGVPARIIAWAEEHRPQLEFILRMVQVYRQISAEASYAIDSGEVDLVAKLEFRVRLADFERSLSPLDRLLTGLLNQDANTLSKHELWSDARFAHNGAGA